MRRRYPRNIRRRRNSRPRRNRRSHHRHPEDPMSLPPKADRRRPPFVTVLLGGTHAAVVTSVVVTAFSMSTMLILLLSEFAFGNDPPATPTQHGVAIAAMALAPLGLSRLILDLARSFDAINHDSPPHLRGFDPVLIAQSFNFKT
jgi:hypothetical protein